MYLISVVICLSYFTGMVWYLFCDLTKGEGESFISYFGLDERVKGPEDWITMIIAVVYFQFTSLSTVGLGDYHPRSDAERILGTIIILLGVLVTSFVMENLS